MESDVVVGRHVYANLYEIDENIANNEELLRNIVIEAAKLANAKIYDIKSWKISGKKGGVSVIALIVESHIAIHTWTQYRYATVDIYTCGEKADPWKALEYIIKATKPKRYSVYYADRSMIV